MDWGYIEGLVKNTGSMTASSENPNAWAQSWILTGIFGDWGKAVGESHSE